MWQLQEIFIKTWQIQDFLPYVLQQTRKCIIRICNARKSIKNLFISILMNIQTFVSKLKVNDRRLWWWTRVNFNSSRTEPLYRLLWRAGSNGPTHPMPTWYRLWRRGETFYSTRPKGVMQGKSIAVVYTLCTYWNQFSLGGICKQE